jgi:hypothetical protein
MREADGQQAVLQDFSGSGDTQTRVSVETANACLLRKAFMSAESAEASSHFLRLKANSDHYWW